MVLSSEKVTVHLKSWQIGFQILAASLAASLAEFELFIPKICRLGLPHAKIHFGVLQAVNVLFVL